MCGRYSFFIPIEQAEQVLDVKAMPMEGWQHRYNAAPTQLMPVITNELPGFIQFFRWGLIPGWAKDPAIGNKMINTRTESIREKPFFNHIFKHKRCLVPADGYYEWHADGKGPGGAKPKPGSVKQPFRFHLPGDELILMAGLWDTWGPDELHTFSIITCPANADTAPYHDRMPVILSHREAEQWLDNSLSPNELLQLLKPAPEGLLEIYPISTYVNKPGNEGPEVIVRV
jgi:putative SOS response-associated peptidase YedK